MDPIAPNSIPAGETSTALAQMSLFNYAELDDDTASIARRAAADIQERIGRIQKSTVEIGRSLREVSAAMPETFGRWLQAETGMSRRDADGLIAIADYADLNPQLAPTVAQFSRQVQYLLVAPETPESAREEAVTRKKSKETITPKKAREIVKRHKTAAPKPLERAATRKPVQKPTPAPAQPAEAAVGVCKTCGCTETTPCTVEGVPCSWTSEDGTECTACRDLPDNAWSRSMITITIQLFPHDGNPAGRHVSVAAKNAEDQPILQFVREGEMPPFVSGPVQSVIDKLKSELPERFKRALVTKRLEVQKALEEVERAKKARQKTKTSKPAAKSKTATKSKAPAKAKTSKKARKK